MSGPGESGGELPGASDVVSARIPEGRPGQVTGSAPPIGALAFDVLARVCGTRFDADATQDACRRVTSFFREHLREIGTPSTRIDLADRYVVAS